MKLTTEQAQEIKDQQSQQNQTKKSFCSKIIPLFSKFIYYLAGGIKSYVNFYKILII